MGKNGNFVLQSLLRRLFDIGSIQFIASALQHIIAQLFDNQKIGVLQCLLDAFRRSNLRPNAMIKIILQKVQNDGDKNIIFAFLYLNMNGKETTHSLIKSKLKKLCSQYCVLGCLLFASMIRCNSNFLGDIAKCFLQLSEDKIIQIGKDSSGSHVLQSFIESDYIFDSIKWQFLSIIGDKSLHVLCTNKFGNFVMESAFFNLNFPYKQMFAHKVLASATILKGSKLGFMLFAKMKLDLLQRDEAKWKEFISQRRQHRKKNLVVHHDERKKDADAKKKQKKEKFKKIEPKNRGKMQRKAKVKRKKNKKLI